MNKAIPTEIVDYKELIQENYYFIDKSLMIKDFLDYKKKVTLITRPRRFGKTLNMSMMAEFFDITKDSKDTFKGTKIMDTEYASYINQYPTIFLSFGSAKGKKQNLIEDIKTQLQSEYLRYEFIFEDFRLFETENYHKYIESLENYDTLSDISKSLLFLMQKLEDYYGKKLCCSLMNTIPLL